MKTVLSVLLILTLVSGCASQPVMPDVVGLFLDEIAPTFQGLGNPIIDYVYSDQVERGKIIDQQPIAKTTLTQDEPIRLTVSMGGMALANFENRSLEETKQELLTLGLVPIIIDESSTSIPKGNVIKTNPAVNDVVAAGQQVEVYVSLGNQEQFEATTKFSSSFSVNFFIKQEDYNLQDNQMNLDFTLQGVSEFPLWIKDAGTLMITLKSGEQVVKNITYTSQMIHEATFYQIQFQVAVPLSNLRIDDLASIEFRPDVRTNKEGGMDQEGSLVFKYQVTLP